MESQGVHEAVALTVAETAIALRCSPGHIRNLVARGDLRAVRLGGRVIIPAQEVRRVLAVVADLPE